MALDLNDGDLIFGRGKTRFDSDGHMMHKMGNNMAMDLETGDLHIVSGWDDDEDDE